MKTIPLKNLKNISGGFNDPTISGLSLEEKILTTAALSFTGRFSAGLACIALQKISPSSEKDEENKKKNDKVPGASSVA